MKAAYLTLITVCGITMCFGAAMSFMGFEAVATGTNVAAWWKMFSALVIFPALVLAACAALLVAKRKK